MAKELIRVETSLGTLEAYAVDRGGEYPGIAVTLVGEAGTAGQVSWTEVREPRAGVDGEAVLQTHCYNGIDEEPVTVACDPKGEWMSEFEAASSMATPDHDAPTGGRPRDDGEWRESLVVLEVRGDEALLFNPNNSYTPFILASCFRREDKTWSHGRYMSDLLTATCALHQINHPDYTLDAFTPDMVEAYIGVRGVDPEVSERVASHLNSTLQADVVEAIDVMYESDYVGRYVDIFEKAVGREVEDVSLDALNDAKLTECAATDSPEVSDSPVGEITHLQAR